MKANITIITGSPGTGKSTISTKIAELSDAEKSVHIHTDDFYDYLVKGAIPPQMEESFEQNRIVMAAFLAAVRVFASNGFHVIVDGIVGPWFIEPWRELAEDGYQVNYFILRAMKEETLARAMNRTKLTREENSELVNTMWQQFSDLGIYEQHVIDTTKLGIEETAEKILANIAKPKYLL